MENAGELVGQTLDGFRVETLFEVYPVDYDGRRSKPGSFFRNENIAKAWAGIQDGGEHHNRVAPQIVLTNGTIGFIIGRSVALLDDEAEALKVRNAALEKLTPEEREVLGL